jgi:hypothetical protein
MNLEEAFDELCAYTLAHRDPAFIHQHVVDAFAAQGAGEHTKPIKLTFALVGLYLHVERRFSGRQVQQAHMRLARQRRNWPSFPLPDDRGAMTARDVLGVPAGPGRDQAIHAWCACVWDAFQACRPEIAQLLSEQGICPKIPAGKS